MDSLPEFARPTVIALRDGLRATFGDDLDALYVYGALTFPESEGIGDLDYHAFLKRTPSPQQRAQLVELERLLGDEHAPLGADLDGWFIQTREADGRAAPHHLLHPTLFDGAWALHRAHWLAGRVVVLSGPPPAALVRAPDWAELAHGLDSEWHFVAVSDHDAYAVLNACRILHSHSARDVVQSKFGSAAWALRRFPRELHPPIEEGLSTYRGDRRDVPIGSRDALIEYVRAQLPPLDRVGIAR